MNGETIPGAGVSPRARAYGLGCVCTRAIPHVMRGSASASAGPMRVLRANCRPGPVIVEMILVDSPTYHSSKVAQDPNNSGAPASSVLAVLSFLFLLGAWPRSTDRRDYTAVIAPHALVPMFRSTRLC